MKILAFILLIFFTLLVKNISTSHLIKTNMGILALLIGAAVFGIRIFASLPIYI